MPFEEGMSIPEELLFRMKSLKGMTKNIIDVLPSAPNATYGPGSITTWVLPYSSLISLKDIAITFDGETSGAPILQTNQGPIVHSNGVLFPRYTSSLIEQMELRCNGQIIQQLNNYNDTYNILRTFSSPGTNSAVLENSDLRKKRTLDRALMQLDEVNDMAYSPNITFASGPRGQYSINSFYGLLGNSPDQTSSSFIDTNLCGELILSIRWAQPNVLVYSQNIQDAIPANQANVDAMIVQAKAVAQPTYHLTNLKLSLTRYNFPQSFYSAIASNLSNGSIYKISFNHYEQYSNPANVSGSSVRFNINSRDIKWLMGYYTNASRNSDVKPHDIATVETFPQSAYFQYPGFFHKHSQWLIGSTLLPQNPQDNFTCYLNLTRLMGEKEKDTYHIPEIDDLLVFEGNYFVAPLSLEYSEDKQDIKLLSALSSENLPISVAWNYTHHTDFPNFNFFDFNANVLVCSTRILEIGNGQQVSVSI